MILTVLGLIFILEIYLESWNVCWGHFPSWVTCQNSIDQLMANITLSQTLCYFHSERWGLIFLLECADKNCWWPTQLLKLMTFTTAIIFCWGKSPSALHILHGLAPCCGLHKLNLPSQQTRFSIFHAAQHHELHILQCRHHIWHVCTLYRAQLLNNDATLSPIKLLLSFISHRRCGYWSMSHFLTSLHHSQKSVWRLFNCMQIKFCISKRFRDFHSR